MIVYESVGVVRPDFVLMELRRLSAVGERSRRRMATGDDRRNRIEIADTDFALMPGRGVALDFGFDPAGNVSKRFSAAGFPFARYGGSCSRWVVHTAFGQPGAVQVQIAELPDGAAYLCFARTVIRPALRWGEPRPVHVVAMGCSLAHANELAYADGLDLERAKVGIGLSCRLCDRPDCRSRAFPPLEHRLALDPLTASATPYRFEARDR
jgi:predicted transcriptional regulator